MYHADAPGVEVEAQYPQYTATFAYEAGTYDPDSRDPNWKLPEISLIGIIVGFGATFAFLAFAVVVIIIDEAARHKDLESKVEEAKETLRNTYNCTVKEMNEIDAEFHEKEIKGDQFDAEAEQKALAEIN